MDYYNRHRAHASLDGETPEENSESERHATLSPTHGVNIVVGYFTRQQPRDYEFAMHRSITAGKLADFVVLSDDLHTVDREKIKDVKIVRTVVGGKTVYQA